jgi:chromosome segregation protein
MSEETQFIVITHAKRTMEAAQALYGVTMQEPGVSKLVSVKFDSPPQNAPMTSLAAV